MESIDYCYWTLGLTISYFIILITQRRYRQLSPSVVHTFIWLATSLLMILQLKGILSPISNEKFQLVSKFIFFIVLSSIIGFVFAHITTLNKERNGKVELICLSTIENILSKFNWIPLCCGIVGLILFVFLFSSNNATSFAEYRVHAVNAERTGIASIAQQISGHINIFGNFYIMLLGYKYGCTKINTKEFLKIFILCSLINMSIGGRTWIIYSTFPFLSTFLFTRHYSYISATTRKKDNKTLIAIIVCAVAAFSIIGLIRANPGNNTNAFEKFLYLTDGPRMTNMVLSQYPQGSYEMEYGKSTFLSSFITSPMNDKFKESISHDIGLRVTVRSIMPHLYYDYGFWGGAVAWGIICFMIESIWIRLKYSNKIISILLLGTFSFILFQAPIGNIFALNTPVFEWIIIIYILRKYVFKGIPNIKNHI